jgi:hypothetical protein
MNHLVFLQAQKLKLFVLELNKKTVTDLTEHFLFLGQCEEKTVWMALV